MCPPPLLASPQIYTDVYFTFFIGDTLRGELPPRVAPDWIDWGVHAPAVPESEEELSSPEVDPFDNDDRWQPFLEPRRKRARTAAVVTSEEEEEEDIAVSESDQEKQAESFPYPVDTKVARDFGDHGIFWGAIEKHYLDDPNLCLVRFTDGDREDLDRDEIQYAIQLYEKKFSVGILEDSE